MLLAKQVMETIDRTLKDIMNSSEPFGGKTIVFSGDFRQILPVCPRSSRAQIVSAALNRSRLWKHVEIHHLTENERVKRVGSETNCGGNGYNSNKSKRPCKWPDRKIPYR